MGWPGSCSFFPVSLPISDPFSHAAQLPADPDLQGVIDFHAHAGPDSAARSIRSIGARHCILTSDLGQAGNPLHHDGLRTFIQALRQEGITDQEIQLMTRTHPAKLLGMD